MTVPKIMKCGDEKHVRQKPKKLLAEEGMFTSEIILVYTEPKNGFPTCG